MRPCRPRRCIFESTHRSRFGSQSALRRWGAQRSSVGVGALKDRYRRPLPRALSLLQRPWPEAQYPCVSCAVYTCSLQLFFPYCLSDLRHILGIVGSMSSRHPGCPQQNSEAQLSYMGIINTVVFLGTKTPTKILLLVGSAMKDRSSRSARRDTKKPSHDRGTQEVQLPAASVKLLLLSFASYARPGPHRRSSIHAEIYRTFSAPDMHARTSGKVRYISRTLTPTHHSDTGPTGPHRGYSSRDRRATEGPGVRLGLCMSYTACWRRSARI